MAIKMNDASNGDSVIVDGGSTITLQDGQQASNRLLVSDADGKLNWRSPVSLAFTMSVSRIQSNATSNLTVSCLPFRHYWAVGYAIEAFNTEQSHVFNMPTSPTQGDTIRITNAETTNKIVYVGSTVHRVCYAGLVTGSVMTVPVGQRILLRTQQTIELVFATENSAVTIYPAWYVSSLSALSFDYTA